MPADIAITKHLLEETVWGSGGWNVPVGGSGGWGTGISGVLMWEWMVVDDVLELEGVAWGSLRENRRY